MNLLLPPAQCPRPFVKAGGRMARLSLGSRTHYGVCSSHCSQETQRMLIRIQAERDQSTEADSKEEELPPWIRNERERELAAKEGADLPYPVYLIASALVAIAAVGSMFEYFARHAIFGVLPPDNILWAPILGFFAITGLPSAGYLFVRAIRAGNREAERQDKIDGY